MTRTPEQDPIPRDVAEFIEFFAHELADVSFPDVDAERLDALASAVRERADELAQLGEQVRVARAALKEAQAQLGKQAQRGLAYARVYADGDEQLSQSVSALALARPEPTSKPTRKRKAKTRSKNKTERKPEPAEAPTAELPFSESSPEAA